MIPSRPTSKRLREQGGQSVAEFALILPVMLLIAVAVGDFGRIYATIVTLESAVREAADYGAFKQSNWLPENQSSTLLEMERRACTAARNLPGWAYDGTKCLNPTFVFEYNHEQTSVNGQPPIPIVMARGTFVFTTAISFPPIPDSVTIVRESRFAVSGLPTTLDEGSPDPTIEAPPSIEPPPTESPIPTPTATPEPSAEPTPTATPEPTPTPTSTPGPSPAPTQSPDATPFPSSSVDPSSGATA